MTKKLKPNMYVQRKILNVNNKKYMSQGLVRKVQKSQRCWRCYSTWPSSNGGEWRRQTTFKEIQLRSISGTSCAMIKKLYWNIVYFEKPKRLLDLLIQKLNILYLTFAILVLNAFIHFLYSKFSLYEKIILYKSIYTSKYITIQVS